MSESRKSDGDMLEEDLESCSLASVTLNAHVAKQKTLDQKRKNGGGRRRSHSPENRS